MMEQLERKERADGENGVKQTHITVAQAAQDKISRLGRAVLSLYA